MTIKGLDTAEIKPCPNCGKPVRQFGNDEWWRHATEKIETGWWCLACLHVKCVTSAAAIK